MRRPGLTRRDASFRYTSTVLKGRSEREAAATIRGGRNSGLVYPITKTTRGARLSGVKSATKLIMRAQARRYESDEWIDLVGEQLRPRAAGASPIVLDLFAGCGGLALGFEAAGFSTVGFEMAEGASATYRANLSGHCHTVRLEVGQGYPRAEVIIGGPPCQPFSVNGDQLGKQDARDGFPIFLDAVEKLHPRLVIVENVKGMLFRNKVYFHTLVKRLEGLGYSVDARVLNAQDFGVPQNRQRLFIVASHGGWVWPSVQTSAPVTVGEALSGFLVQPPPRPKWLNEKHDRYIASYEAKSQCRAPRDLNPAKPSRTVTCRNLYAMTGDMLRVRMPDGRRRMLSVREAARLQSFPDWFDFKGSETRQFEMIGNAVPPLLGLAVAEQARAYLDGTVEGGGELLRLAN